MNNESYYQLTDRNQPAPPRPKWFDLALQQIGSDTGCQFRLVWAPDITAWRWGSMVRLYAAEMRAKHRGWFKARYAADKYGVETLQKQSYHPVNAYRDYNPEGAHLLPDGGWLIPDIEKYQIAYPRFIVERRAPDSERTSHEANRYDWDPDTGERIDVLGPWPEGGRWYNLYVVATHIIACCNEANAQHRLCYGIGRDPNDNDLEYVRKIVADELAAPRRPEPGSQEWNRQYSQNVKAAYAEHDEGYRRQRANYALRMSNTFAPTLGNAAMLDTTLPETISTAPPVILDRFQRAARDHMLDLERRGDVYDGTSTINLQETSPNGSSS